MSMPNFVIFGQSVANILRLLDFSRWRPSAILKNFSGVNSSTSVGGRAARQGGDK